MLISYLFRGFISSLAIFGLFNRVRLLSLKTTSAQVILGTLAYGLFRGTGYTIFLITVVLITLTFNLPVIQIVLGFKNTKTPPSR